MTLPLERIAERCTAAERDDTPAAALHGRPLRVLVAEDNDPNQPALRTLLLQVGVDPVVVSEGRGVLEAWQESSWDLILMDICPS